MQLTLVTPTLGRDGGVATHVVTSANAMARAGHSVAIVAGERRLDAHATNLPIEERIVPALMHSQLSSAEVAQVERAVHELRADVIHVHDVAHPMLVRRLRGRAPLVASAHGYPGCAPNTYYFSPGHECTRARGPLCVLHMAGHGCLHSKDIRAIPRAYRNAGTRLAALRSADRILAYSAAVRRNLARNDVPSTLIPLFPTIPPKHDPIPRREPDLVLFVGRIVPAKGLHVLVKALPHTRARLVVCGDGWARGYSEKCAERLGVASRVEFLGWVDEAILASLLARATVIAVPSVWPEPFGLVGVEAMTYGLPAVGTATGGIPEWLSDRQTGLLVPPGDPDSLARALNSILEDITLQHRFGLEARRQVEAKFTEQRHVTALEEVYGDLLRSS